MRVFFNIIAISFLFLLSPNFSYANQADPIPPPGLDLTSRSVTKSFKSAATSTGLPARGSLETIVLNALKYILSLVGLIAFILLVYAGFRWMTAGGDSSAVDQAREIALTTVGGLLVIAFSLSMVGFVGQAIDSIFGKGDGKPALTPVLSATSQVAKDNFKLATPEGIAARATVFLLGVAGFIAIVFVIYGGTRWMLAFGDDKAVSAGQTIIINSLGGLVLVMLAYGITVFTLQFVTSLAPNETTTSTNTSDISEQTICRLDKPPESGCNGAPGEFTCKRFPDEKYSEEGSPFKVEFPNGDIIEFGYCEKVK